MNILKKLWDWTVKSSANPEKLSLTLKAGIPYLVLFVGWTKFGINEAEVVEATDALVVLLVKVVEIVTAIIAGYGAVRKVYNTAAKAIKPVKSV